MSRHQARLDALRDPEYHRHLMFGAVDESRAAQLGRPLLPHEAQSRIPWPQLKVINRIERAIASRAGEKIPILISRQGGKNESSAFVHARALNAWSGVPGSVLIRTAPTYRPQIVNSKLRLEKFTGHDPFLRGRTRHREGYIVECGGAQIQFLSGGANANVVGATASIALDVDEAHKIDLGKFEEDFGPFTASTNAPTILWGVAADGLDLLHEYREQARGTDRLLEFPASVWCELSPAYAAHYAQRVAELGEDHPVILTQYRLIPVESIGTYLSAAQQRSLFAGDHSRLSGPRPGFDYLMVADIGGESELEVDEVQRRAEEPERDATFIHIAEVDNDAADSFGAPLCRVVYSDRLTGERHSALQRELRGLIEHWGIAAGVIDARGVGEADAMEIHNRYPSVLAYKATAADVSTDCYATQALLNRGRIRYYRADPAADEDLREMQAEARHTRYEIRSHDRMRLTKPTGVGSTGKHIDGLKALTYLHRVLPRFSGPLWL